MELWLDTIDMTLIANAAQQFPLAGVTTNPSILSQSPDSVAQTIRRLLHIQPGKVAVQVTADDHAGMLQQAQRLAAIDPRIVIKIPITPAGLQTIKQLHILGIATIATAMFEPAQFYLSQLAGATYAALYLSHVEKNNANAQQVIAEMLNIARAENSPKLMAAAIQTKSQIMQCATQNVPAITLPPGAYQELTAEHPLTTTSLQRFAKDWAARKNTEASTL
jgi:TalC/MipB family fructose-6-phosphate aldolase